MAAPTNSASLALTGNTSATSYTPALSTLASGAAVGDKVQVFLAFDGNPTVALSSQSTTDGWVLVAQAADSTNACKGALLRFLVKAAGTIPDPTVTWSGNESVTGYANLIKIATAGKVLSQFAIGANSQGSSTNPNPPASTNDTGATQDVLFHAYWAGDGVTASTAGPTNYTGHASQTISNAANGCSVGFAMRTVNGVVNAGSEDPGTFTRATEQWVSYTTSCIEIDPVQHDCTATNVATSAPEITSATLGHIYNLGDGDVVGGPPEITVATLSQKHVLGSQTVATTAPEITQATATFVDTSSRVMVSWIEFEALVVETDTTPVLTADPGSYVITGVDATIGVGRGALIAAPGAYNITGQPANILYGHTLIAAPGAYNITGTATGLTKGGFLTANPGAYNITGTAAALLAGWKLDATVPGSYVITGQPVSLLVGRILPANVGSYIITGTAATVSKGGTLDATAPGSYVITGVAANLLFGHTLIAAPGSYLITGTAAATARGYTITAVPGSYFLTGIPLDYGRIYALATDVGSYLITGQDADFRVETLADIIPLPDPLVIFRHQEAEIVRVPKLNELARQVFYNRSDVLSMAELAMLAPEMGGRVHVWDTANGYRPAYADGLNWRDAVDGTVLI